MAIINTSKVDTFDAWRIKTNTTSSQLGDNAKLLDNSTLTTTTAVDAIIEVLTKVESEIGTIGALTTFSTKLVNAINEHDAEIGVLQEVLGGEDDVIHPGLSTKHTSTLVGAINEIVARETSRYENTVKLDLEHDTVVDGSNTSTQGILSNLSLPAGKTFTINGTLDISEGSLTVGGGVSSQLNINTTLLGLGTATATDAPLTGGIIIRRGTVSESPRNEVGILWDGTTDQWTLKRLDGEGNNITPYILDNINFSDIITTGTQSGIEVTYDKTDNSLDFDVKDFTITLTGDVTGTGTVTDLGDVSIATTVQLEAVALGTDTTGAYVQSITLDADNPGISLTQSAAGDASNAITALQVDSTVVRDFGEQSIAGVKTFSDKPVFNAGITVGDASTDTSSFKGDVTFDNNVEVKGNLVVTGTTTTVNSTEVNLADNILLLNSDFVGYPDIANLGTGLYTAPSENVGIKVNRGYSNTSGNPLLSQPELVWNETDDVWKINDGSSAYTLVGSIKLDDATLSARTITTTADSKEISTNNYANITVGDYVTSANIPAGTFVTSIDGTTKLILSNAATASGTNIAATFKHESGLNVSSSKHVTTLEHYTPSSVALDSNNTGGTVLQDVSFDQFGHVKSIGTYNLDNRYYTESEADNRFVNVSGDTMTGNLTMAYYGDTTTPGFTVTFTGDGSINKRYLLPHYIDNTDKILSVTVAGSDALYTVSGRFLTLSNVASAGQVIEIKGKAPRVVTGKLLGNAETASEALKWSTPRKLTLGGDASGNVTFDGNSDVEMSVTVAAGSHTHTAVNVSDFGAAVANKIAEMVTIGTAQVPKASFNGGVISIVDRTVDGTVQQFLSFDANDPTFKLTGAVTGETTQSNLGNVTITTSIDDTNADLIAAIKKQMPNIYNASGIKIFPAN